MMELSDMITTLTDADDRAIMRLHYIDGHTFKEIADAIGMSQRNAIRHARHAKQELAHRFPDTFRTDIQRPRIGKPRSGRR